MNNKTKLKAILSKVLGVTLFFWIIKILSTTVGETFSDFLSVNLGLGLTITSVMMVYIMTRPLGASLGDLLSQAKENGSLGIGAVLSALKSSHQDLNLCKTMLENSLVTLK